MPFGQNNLLAAMPLHFFIYRIKTMFKIAVNGACGKMGARIAALVLEDPELKLVAALERAGHPSLEKTLVPSPPAVKQISK